MTTEWRHPRAAYNDPLAARATRRWRASDCSFNGFTVQPTLNHIRQTLARLADRERMTGNPSGIVDERQVVGPIDPAEPAILQRMRRELRLRRKARETEKAYVGWAARFIDHCGSEDLPQVSWSTSESCNKRSSSREHFSHLR